MTVWARVVSLTIGVGLMACPALLGYGGVAADIHHVVGPLAASVAIIAIGQSVRAVRWCNAALGVALVTAAAVVDHPPRAAAVAAAAALGLIVTSCVRGAVPERLGGGWRAVWSRSRHS